MSLGENTLTLITEGVFYKFNKALDTGISHENAPYKAMPEVIIK